MSSANASSGPICNGPTSQHFESITNEGQTADKQEGDLDANNNTTSGEAPLNVMKSVFKSNNIIGQMTEEMYDARSEVFEMF